MDARDWLAGRYGSVLFALLLTGAWFEAQQRAAILKRNQRLPKWVQKMVNSPYHSVTFSDKGFQIRSTFLGRLRAKRRPIALVVIAAWAGWGLGLIIMQMGSGALSTLFGGVDATWDNGAGTGVWNTAANWSGDAIPDGTATFNATSTANCAIDVAVNITSITVAAGYTGTISHNAGISVTTSGAWSIAAGAWTTNNEAVTVGSWTQSGGTANLGSSTATCNGAYTHSGGTFTYGTSTWVAAGNGTYTGTVAIANSMTGEFYNLTVNTGVTVTLAAASLNWTVNAVTMNGTGTVSNPVGRINQFNIAAGQAVTCDSGAGFSGAGRTIVATNGNINFQGGTHSVTMFQILAITTSTPIVTITANVICSGAGSSPNGAFALGMWNETLGAGLMTVDANGYSFTVANGTFCVGAQDTGGTANGRAFMKWGSSTGHNIKNLSCGVTTVSSYMDMGSGAIAHSGNWDDRGTSASHVVGTSTVTSTGASPTLRQDSASDHIYNFRFNGSGTISTTTNNFRCANQLRVSAGTLTPSVAIGNAASYLIDGGTLTWNNASSAQAGITASSGTLSVTVNDTFTGVQTWSGATVAFAATTQTFSGAVTASGGSVTVTTANLTFSSTLTISGATFGGNSAYALNLDGNFTLSSGTLSAPNASGTFTIAGAANTWSGGTFTANSGTVTWDRAGNQTDTFTTAVTFVTMVAGGSGTKNIAGNPCPTYTTRTNSGGVFGGSCIRSWYRNTVEEPEDVPLDQPEGIWE